MFNSAVIPEICVICFKCSQSGLVTADTILDQNKQNFSVLDVACPFCGFVMQGKVQKITSCIYTNDIKNSNCIVISHYKIVEK